MIYLTTSDTRQEPARPPQEHFGQRPALFLFGDAFACCLLLYSAYFWLPFAYGCTPCEGTSHCAANTTSTGTAAVTVRRRALSAAETNAADGSRSNHHGLEDTQWNCRQGEYNELATLLHSAQEGAHSHPPPSLFSSPP